MSTSDWTSLETFAFGDSAAMADELVNCVLSGAKRATCWSVREGQQTYVGKRMVAKDGAGTPRVVIETTHLEQKRFNDVELTFALAEGEGFETLEDWRNDHRSYFERNGGFSPNMMLWCERFTVVEIISEPAS